MSRRLLVGLAAALATAAASAQQLRTYTESTVGPAFLTYGLPVPLPIESLAPVDGFRSYASVQARLQAFALESGDLAAHDVGRTHAGRTVWAYVASDDDGTDVEGRPEAAFFINASTHAREWATPEVSTGTIERLMAGADARGVERYVLDNTRLVIIPIHNVDGVLQTQRYPTEVLVGADPDFPQDWPRDGRMRRKNMRGVDEVLLTTADHLLGIDLNRNHPPFWATTPSRSSPNVNSLVHHGSGPHSEPENQAIVTAARLGPETRFRLGIDLHSHSSVFFSSNTGRTRLNNVQRNLIQRLSNHHRAVAGAFYPDITDPANVGIGTAQEYFSYTWLVPGWTMELEPGDAGAAQYGGAPVTHGGFILPASQARRVREGWAETHLVAFYQMSGPPHLSRVRYVDMDTGAVARQDTWRYDGATARRARIAEVPGTLAPGRRYRAELAFNKPMRWRNAQGDVVSLPGVTTAPAPVLATMVQGTTRTTLDTAAGTWQADVARTRRYRDDTFAFEFTAPNTLGDYVLEVSTSDFAGASLDSDPSTPADWAEGAWSEYENTLGIDGDIGGADRSAAFGVANAPVAQVSVSATRALAGEGDVAHVVVTRGSGAGRLELRRTDVTPALTVASWDAGQGGERTLVLSIADNAEVDGERDASVPLQEIIDGVPGATFAAPLRVLDNDDSTRAVWRVHDEAAWVRGWDALAARAGAGELVVDRDDYLLAYPAGNGRTGGLAAVQSRLALHGNGATLLAEPAGANGAMLAVAAGGSLELDALRVELDALPVEPVLDSDGTLRVARSTLIANPNLPSIAVPLLRSRGALDLVASGLNAVAPSESTGLLDVGGGNARILSSSLGNGRTGVPYAGAPLAVSGGSVTIERSALQGYPIVRRVGTGQAPTTRGSLLDEAFGSLMPVPPEFQRAPCAFPMLIAGGGNVITAHYAGGSADGLRDSGCIVRTGDDSFDAGVAVEVLGDYESRYVLRSPNEDRTDFDGVTACLATDQRGAPRPQSRRGSILAPQCDAGAYEPGFNPRRGIWSPQRAGHGLDIQTVGNRLFLAWYTYDATGEPTAYQASAPFTGQRWEATLQQSSRNPQGGAITVSDVGIIRLLFQDDTHATLSWRFNGGFDAQENIVASNFASGAPRVQVTGLWYPPTDSGQGATITRQGETTAFGVYYYDAQGKVRWALGSGNAADAQDIAMTSFRGFCPDCGTVPVTGMPAGRVRAHFHTPREAKLELELTYPGAAGGTWNRSPARYVPLNDAVDNDAR